MSSGVDLKKCLDQVVEISFKNSPLTLKGQLYSIIESSNIIVILSKRPDADESNPLSHIINLTQVSKITLIKEDSTINKQYLINVDMDKIMDSEKRNLSKDILIKKADTEPYFAKGLKIYEELSKLYKCSFDGKRIVLDEVDSYIEEPFRLKNLHCEDEAAYKHLSKIVAAALKAKK
ncbi:MAG: hypothetical protein MJ252_18420 [archaeon]|nr:hypothetical protein [archaeon]